MAIRREELHESEGVVLHFPSVHRRTRTKYLVRRVAVGAVGAVVVIIGAALMHDGPTGTGRPAGRAGAIVGSVTPGDTLWDLARRYSPPGADLRAYVDRLVSANRLAGRPLQAGMRLRFPK
ncbi:MAG: LysM peptidoglycan-binding domain-containing protein [Actinomycetota bacterium]|nr:LysM peptidoglycan-binding domain-containing protein [Actinomycetota bacterium]